MPDRSDELKGNVKRGIGDLTDNERLEAEGRAEAESARAKRQAKGAANKVKGSIQEGIGKMTGDESTRAQGTADRLRGETQQRG
jgi:uncharacterized protein YjbJ (UPF0337 family)